MRTAIPTDDEFPRDKKLFVVPTNGSYAVLNDRYDNLAHLERVMTTLPISRVAVIRGLLERGYRIDYSPENGEHYRQIAVIKVLNDSK